MADNVAITAGAGTTVRTDDVGGIQIQVIKIALGADGAEDLLLDSGQKTMAASLPVVVASDQSAIHVEDAGPSQTVTRTFTYNADISTARDITAAPTAGQKIVAMDIIISVDTSCYVTIQMETSANVLWGGYMTASSPIQLTPRGYIKADLADKKLMMKSSAASKGACTCIFFSEA